MSKSTRMTPEQLRSMNLEEVEPGKYRPKQKGDKAFTLEPTDKYVMGIDPASDEPSHSAAVKELFQTGMSATKNGVFVKTKDVVKEYLFLVVKGEPTPQQRHRHHQVKGSDFVTTYDPSSKAKKEFLKQCFPYRPEKPYERPLRVDMVFYFSRPKSHYRSGKYANLLKDGAPEYHTSRNDADNCAKFVMDALNKTFWKDDALISMMSVIKKYDDNPRTEITITPL